MSANIRVEGRREGFTDCARRLSKYAGKFRRKETTDDDFLDQVMVEFYHLATTISPTFKELERSLDFGYDGHEGSAILAAIIVCIWHPYNAQPNPDFAFVSRSIQIIATSISLPEQIQARPLFIACKDATLDRLQAIDQEVAGASGGVSLLQNPGFPQLLVVLAILVGNKQLATGMIENYPPGPDHDTLFSPRALRKYWPDDSQYSTTRHPIYASVADVDTGCDVWVYMVKHSWATPRLNMLSVALSSPDIPSGQALIRELLPLILARPDLTDADISETLWHALRDGGAQPGAVDTYLGLYNPKARELLDQTRYVSRSAAYHYGSANLEVLLGRDAADFFGMDPDQHTAKRQRTEFFDAPGDEFYGHTKMSTALHHAARACNAESVEFLLAQPGGAEPRRDGYGRTAYDYLKNLEDFSNRLASIRSLRPEDTEPIYAIFERVGWRLSTPEEIKAAATPVRLTDQWGSSTLYGL